MLEKLYKYLPQSCWVYCCISVLALILLGIIGVGPDNWMYLNGYRTFWITLLKICFSFNGILLIGLALY